MTVLRSIWSDLVDKRLWPVAAVLAIALVAVPVVLGGGSSSGGGAAAPAAAGAPAGGAAAPTAQTAQVSLDDTLSAADARRAGKVRDPFKALRKAAAPSTTTAAPTTAAPTATPTPAAGGGATATPGPSDGDTPRPAPSAPAAPAKPVAKVNPLDLFRVSIRFGKAGDLKTHRDIARLTPLPSSEYPFFVYLGVLADKKTAVFLVSSDVKATGDGTCRPSRLACDTVELRAGETEFFDYSPTGDDSDVTQFQMDLLSVHRRTAATVARAARSRAAVDRKGRRVVRAAHAAKLIPQLDGYRYSARDGLLHRAHRTRRAKDATAKPARDTGGFRRTRWGYVARAAGALVYAPRR